MPLTALQYVLKFLDSRPTAYLNEVALALFDRFDVNVHLTTIWRCLKRQRWSRKTVKHTAAQRSAPLRASWISRAEKWPVDKLIFINETASCEKTGWRKRGWSPRGLSCIELRNYKREERWSVLPALTTNSIIDNPLIIQGSVTKEAFR